MTESQNATPACVELRRGYEPGLIGRVGELHGRYYAAAWGVGAPFEIMMTREFCEFIEHYDPNRDIVVSAHIGGVLIGSISIVGERAGAGGAQLRFFLVDPKYHGYGAGKALLKAALEWCRERGFRKVFLWTVDHLPQSRRLYEQAGFRVTTRCIDDRYTAPLECLKLECSLDLKSNQDEAAGTEHAARGGGNPARFQP
jgi:GNAT superfamily N-acetyltransferase